MNFFDVIKYGLGAGAMFATLAVISSANGQGLGIPGQPLPRQAAGALRGGGVTAPMLQSPGQMLPPLRRGNGNINASQLNSVAPRSYGFTSQAFRNQSQNMVGAMGGQQSSQQMINQSRNVRRW